MTGLLKKDRHFSPIGTELAFHCGMSNKYLVLADVEGEVKFLCMRSNGSTEQVERLCYEMTEKLFSNQSVGKLWVEPWPLGGITNQRLTGSIEPFLTRQAS